MAIKRIAYLHGLESKNIGPKNDYLHKNFKNVYDPHIDYKEARIGRKILTELKEFKADLIIGSSMGGMFAYKLSKMLNIPALLFNPALNGTSMIPDMTGFGRPSSNPKTHYVFGVKDKIVDPEETLRNMSQEDVKTMTYVVLDHAHRTPPKVFISEFESFVSKL